MLPDTARGAGGLFSCGRWLPHCVTVVLLISGSTRAGSTNTAALRTVQAVAPDGIEARWYGGPAELPAFVPEAP
ncbi:NAD(P)H-dependent oxidoreductase, partial [Nocardia zapadnayensis]|nr:NAD(P)H-dependent oxidoreductase [Nocardia zapadnayensis]